MFFLFKFPFYLPYFIFVAYNILHQFCNLWDFCFYFLFENLAESRLCKAGFWHSRDNIFHINTLSGNEIRSALLSFAFKNVCVCLAFLRSSQPELPEKHSPKVYDYIKTPLHDSQDQRKKAIKNALFQCGFLRTLLIWQQCIQNIPNNLREADWKKFFFEKKYMFENTGIFYFLWKKVKKLNWT